MEAAKELVLNLKQNNKSHVGYGLQKECEALIRHILQNMAKTQLPPLNPEMKNEKDSIRYREEGNQQFVAGDDMEAIESYTISLAYADSKESMAYAHANRSAALYRKQMYYECLIDIDAALNLGYPEEKQKKLKERGRKAMEEIQKSIGKSQEKENLISNGKEIDELFSTTDTNKSNRVQVVQCDTVEETVIPKKCSLLDDTMRPPIKSKRYLADDGGLKLAYGPSKEAPVLSAGVAIDFSDTFGRNLVATQEFRPGDVITIEEPYAHVIYVEKYYKHCHNCLSRSYNLIPCPECPIGQYCSEKCRKLAWSQAHRIECPILALLSNLLNVDKDKIRMITKIMRLLIILTDNGTKIRELRKDMEIAEVNPDSRTAGFTDEGVMDSKSARSALSLATNMTTRPLIGISAFACISSLTALLLATQTTFFGKKYKVKQLNDITELSDIPFCGSIMFRACVIMSSNCFSVQQEPGIKSGSGLYVLHSLYNHSCAPNTFRHFEGMTMITRACQTIKPGDQIFTSYGVASAYMGREERKKKLMDDYFFDCQCVACKNIWPTYSEILRNHIGSIASNKELVKQLKPFKQRLIRNKYDIDAVRSVLAILEKEVTQPCEEIVHAEQYLKSYYLGKFD